ncbi:MAG: type II secretion system major pseudopilin GspG [Pseudomonadota bacterium]
MMRKDFKRLAQPTENQAGFTLVEIMVVMAIIGLLATMVIINVLPSQDKAMREKAVADVALLEQALDLYRLDLFRYPSTVEGLDALVNAPTSLDNPANYRNGGYIKRLPEDPWGRPYQYASPGRFAEVDVYSLGADGREGGEGDDADIGNWQ